jgi:hypothetical protein
MRESRLYGFVRGALSNERPYRVICAASAHGPGCVKTRGRSIAIEQISRSRLFEVLASQAHSISKSNLRISFSSCFGILSFHTAWAHRWTFLS